MSSIQRLVGRPTLLRPSLGVHSVQRLVQRLSVIRATWPAHLHFILQIYSNTNTFYDIGATPMKDECKTNSYHYGTPRGEFWEGHVLTSGGATSTSFISNEFHRSQLFRYVFQLFTSVCPLLHPPAFGHVMNYVRQVECVIICCCAYWLSRGLKWIYV